MTQTRTFLLFAWLMVAAASVVDDPALQARAEPYKLCTVPRGALILTAGVDVQRNRWEITVYGWGRGLESWVVDVAVLEGNPAVDEEWGAVLEYLQRRYPQDCGGLTMGLSAIIDPAL